MSATLTTFGNLLKEYYQGPIIDSLNNRVWARDYFAKRTQGWSGNQMIIPVHVGRNSGVGFKGETDSLPTAGSQSYVKLAVTNKNMYGTFKVTGEAMDTATGDGPGAFAGIMREEMDRLVQDVANGENLATTFGGPVRGFINEKKTLPDKVGGAAQNTGDQTTFGAATAFEYQGDFGYFDQTFGVAGVTLADATPSTWVRVKLIDLDTYQELVGSGTNVNVFVTSFTNSLTAPSVTLRLGTNEGGAAQDISVTAADFKAIGLMIHDTQAVDSNGDAIGQNPASFQQSLTSQPTGIFGNLADPTHFGVDRSNTASVASGQRELKSFIVNHSLNSNGLISNADADLSLERLQSVFDSLLHTAGVDPDVLVMSALMRHRYTVLLTGILGSSNNINLSGESGGVMSQKDNLAYGGVKFQYDRHFPVKSIGLLTTEPWLLCEISSGQFADADGNVLSRISGSDQYEGYWKHRYNMVCRNPKAQAMIVGINPV